MEARRPAAANKANTATVAPIAQEVMDQSSYAVDVVSGALPSGRFVPTSVSDAQAGSLGDWSGELQQAFLPSDAPEVDSDLAGRFVWRESVDPNFDDAPFEGSGFAAETFAGAPASTAAAARERAAQTTAPEGQPASRLPQDTLRVDKVSAGLPQGAMPQGKAPAPTSDGMPQGKADLDGGNVLDAAPRSFEPSAGPAQRRSHGRRLPVVAIAAAALALAVGAGALLLNDPAGQPEKSTAPAAATSSASSSSKTAPAIVASSSEPAVARSATVTVVADGYEATATPIMYHLHGASKDGTTTQRLDRYGFVFASDVADTPVLDAAGNPRATFKLVVGDLPTGDYTLSWSTAILQDGSIYQTPHDQQVHIQDKDVTLDAEFVRLDGATVGAQAVLAAYTSIERWLGNASPEVVEQRDSILWRAWSNANNAASVAAVGGLDKVNSSTTTEKPEETEESSSQTQDQNNAAIDAAATQDQAADAYVEPAQDYTATPAATTDTNAYNANTQADTTADAPVPAIEPANTAQQETTPEVTPTVETTPEPTPAAEPTAEPTPAATGDDSLAEDYVAAGN